MQKFLALMQQIDRLFLITSLDLLDWHRLLYTIRRKIETASSSNINLLAGNDTYFSNIQNLHI